MDKEIKYKIIKALYDLNIKFKYNEKLNFITFSIFKFKFSEMELSYNKNKFIIKDEIHLKNYLKKYFSDKLNLK